MKKLFGKFTVAAFAAMLLTTQVMAIQLEADNKDAVRLNPTPRFNAEVVEASNTTYRLQSKNGALSTSNYGIIGIGSNAYEISANNTLTQGACNTLWGSTTNRDVAIYAAYGDSQGTSVSNSSPSTDISGGSDTNFKIAVDKNPVVNVSLTLTGLSTGAAIATGLTSQINAALAAAGQGGAVDVAYGSVYTITSRLKGAKSSVVVTDGSSANVADNLKIGVANSGVETAGFRGVQLCVSDVAGKTTVGSTAVGSTGYMSCGATLASTVAVSQVAVADLNCTGPVIGTVKSSASTGLTFSAKKIGSASSATTGSANLVFLVPGLESGDKCLISATALGTGPAYLKSSAVTAGTITAVADASQSGGTTTINYACY